MWEWTLKISFFMQLLPQIKSRNPAQPFAIRCYGVIYPSAVPMGFIRLYAVSLFLWGCILTSLPCRHSFWLITQSPQQTCDEALRTFAWEATVKLAATGRAHFFTDSLVLALCSSLVTIRAIASLAWPFLYQQQKISLSLSSQISWPKICFSQAHQKDAVFQSVFQSGEVGSFSHSTLNRILNSGIVKRISDGSRRGAQGNQPPPPIFRPK